MPLNWHGPNVSAKTDLFGDSERCFLVITSQQYNTYSHSLQSGHCSLSLVFNGVCYCHHGYKETYKPEKKKFKASILEFSSTMAVRNGENVTRSSQVAYQTAAYPVFFVLFLFVFFFFFQPWNHYEYCNSPLNGMQVQEHDTSSYN